MNTNRFNTTAINDLIIEYFAIRERKSVIVAQLRAGFHIGKPGAATKDEVKLSVNRIACGRYGVALNDRGNLPNECAGRKYAERLVAEVMATDKKADAIDVPAEVQALADKLVKSANVYELAAKIIATAIANAKAAK